MMQFLINRIKPGFDFSKCDLVIPKDEQDVYFKVVVSLRMQDTLNDDYVHYVYLSLYGFTVDSFRSSLIKIGFRINSEIKQLGSIVFSWHNNVEEFNDNYNHFIDLTSFHCSIYKWFGDFHFKNQLEHKKAFLPTLQCAMSKVNNKEILTMRLPHPVGSVTLGNYIDVRDFSSYDQFSVVLIESISRVKSTGISYDIIKSLTPNNSNDSVFALIPTVLMNQFGSLKINYEGEYGPVHSVNLFELNDIHPETFNRSTMQLAPIRDIPFRIKNKDDNVFFNKVICI